MIGLMRNFTGNACQRVAPASGAGRASPHQHHQQHTAGFRHHHNETVGEEVTHIVFKSSGQGGQRQITHRATKAVTVDIATRIEAIGGHGNPVEQINHIAAVSSIRPGHIDRTSRRQRKKTSTAMAS